MISRFKRTALPFTAALFLVAAFVGCAGSKSSSSYSSGDSNPSAEPEKNQRLEDARRSAEEAELKAHQLRQEKNRNTAKSN